VTQTMLPYLRLAKGRIVNISSIGGRIAGQMLGAYHASKFALEALTDSLRQELAPCGIKVISIEPGGIATPIWNSGLNTGESLMAQIPVHGRDYYHNAMNGARKMAEQNIKHGLPPERVALKIEQALTAQRPHARYIVGMDAQIGTRVLAHLPARLRDRVMKML